MKTMTQVSDEELNVLAADDNAAALVEKSRRAVLGGDAVAARKYLTFASVLGNAAAHIGLAQIYENEENFDEAYLLYALAYAKGNDSVLPSLTRLLMLSDSKLGLELLKYHAYEGHQGCIEELLSFYEKADNQKEIKLLKARIVELKQSAIKAKSEKAKGGKSKKTTKKAKKK